MSISFYCKCGKRLKAPDGSEGRRAKCPKCGAIATVPDLKPGVGAEYVMEPEGEEPHEEGLASRVVAAPATDGGAMAAVTSRPLSAYPMKPVRSFRSYTYLFLILALIPLVISTFEKPFDVLEAIAQTVEAHPEVEDKGAELLQKLVKDEASLEDVVEIAQASPVHRLEGAYLPRESKAHWLMALGAAVGFFGLLLVSFSNALKYAKGLVFAGIFTGTVGIVVLLIFQWAAFSMPVVVRGGVIALIFLIIKLIGLSYALAENPDVPLILSFVGFTCGVGLCEEITKAIPLLFRIRSTPGEEEATWNTMLIWGLASGIGFGIAEGIMYSGRYYNGLMGADIYWVRFVSCVLLHAMWSGAVGITMYNRRKWLADAENVWMYWVNVVLIVLVPMILHGLYDTLLKRDHDVLALLVAVASFGWLMFQIERMWRKPPEVEMA